MALALGVALRVEGNERKHAIKWYVALQSGRTRREKSESSDSTDEAGEQIPNGACGGKRKIGSDAAEKVA